MKKLLILTLTILLITGLLLSGCSGADDGNSTKTGTTKEENSGIALSAPGVLPIVDEPITIDYMVKGHSLVIDMATNDATVFLEEKTGIKIEWNVLSPEGTEEKINIILASGDLPSVFYACRINAAQEAQFGTAEGLFIPLNDMIEKQAVEFKSALQDFDYDVMGMITSPDGNVYGLPTLSQCYHCYNSKKMWLNYTWLDNLGLDTPTTTDEFYNVLKAFKEQDANGNGDANDEYPLLGGKQWNGKPELFLMNSYQFYPGFNFPFSIKGGAIQDTVMNDEYKEGLMYLKMLYDEGLIYEASYTHDNDQVKKMMNNEISIVGAIPAGNIIGGISNTYDNSIQYDGLSPLEGPEGVQYSLYDPYSAIYQGDFVITTTCEYPEAAVKWADYLYTFDATMAVRYGVEGRDWREPESDEVGLDLETSSAIATILTPWGGNEPRNDNYQWIGPFYESLAVRIGRGGASDVDPWTVGGLEFLLYRVTKNNMEPYQPAPSDYQVPPPVKYLEDENEQLLTIKTDVKNAINEYRTRFITEAGFDINAEWDSYISTLETLGIETWSELYQKAYDRQFG